MLIDVVKVLRSAEVDVDQLPAGPAGEAPQRPDAVLGVTAGDRTVAFAVELRRRAPYPNELPGLESRRRALSEAGQPMLAAPFVSETLGAALAAGGWSWADASGNFELRAPGLLLRQRSLAKAPKPARKRLPRGSGSLAIVRRLIRSGEEELTGTELAAQAGVSQPRVSQVLHQLRQLDLASRTPRGRWRADREALLDRLLQEYAGPGGSELHLYSLDSPMDVALAVARASHSRPAIAVSADVGPDLILAWRRPSIVIIYATLGFDTAALGLVDSHDARDANVIVRTPDDRSVFPVPQLSGTLHDIAIPLADPAQMIWDLQELGGDDRLEAAGMLRQWLLTYP